MTQVHTYLFLFEKGYKFVIHKSAGRWVASGALKYGLKFYSEADR